MEARIEKFNKRSFGFLLSKTQYRRPGAIVKHGQPPAAPSALSSALPKQDFIKMRLSSFLLLFLGLCIFATSASVCMLHSRGCDYGQIKWDGIIGAPCYTGIQIQYSRLITPEIQILLCNTMDGQQMFLD